MNRMDNLPQAAYPKRRKVSQTPPLAFVPLEHENSWGESRCGSPRSVPCVISSNHINALVTQHSQPSPNPLPASAPAAPFGCLQAPPQALSTAPFIGHVADESGNGFVPPSAFCGLPEANDTAPAYMRKTGKAAPGMLAVPEVAAAEVVSEQDGCATTEGAAGSFFGDLVNMAVQAEIESEEIEGQGMRQEELMGLGVEGEGLCVNVDTRRAVEDWLRDSPVDCSVQMGLQEGQGRDEGSLPLWLLEELGETEGSAVGIEGENVSSCGKLVRTLSCGSSTNETSTHGSSAAQFQATFRDAAKVQMLEEGFLGGMTTEMAIEVPSGGLYKVDVPEQSVDSCSDESAFDPDGISSFALMHAGRKDIVLSIAIMEGLLEESGNFGHGDFSSSNGGSSPKNLVPVEMPENISLGWISDPVVTA